LGNKGEEPKRTGLLGSAVPVISGDITIVIGGISKLTSLDWFKGKFTGNPYNIYFIICHGKSSGFLYIFP